MNRKLFVTALALLVGMSAAWADPAVESAQQKLKDQGFYYGEINGKKDADTTAAIRRYQIRNGLQISGELNDETLRSIRATQANAAQSPAAAPPTGQARGSVAPDTSELRAESVPRSRPVNP